MSITFSSLLLSVNEKLPTLDELNGIFTEPIDFYIADETCYLLKKEILKDRYFWMQIEYGSPKPHSDILVNAIDQTKQKNARKENQAEISGQLFLLYDSADSEFALYLSNAKKKSLIEKYLNDKMKGNVVIKNVYIDFEKFVEKIKLIEEVGWVTKKNVLNLDKEISDLFVDTNDLFGYSLPGEIELRIKIISPIDSSFENMKKIKLFKQKIEAHSLTCVGRDDKNIEKILRHENYLRKIDINIGRDKKGFYDPTSVQQELIRRIERLNG